MRSEQKGWLEGVDVDALTPEELQQLVTGVVAGVYQAIMAYEKLPKGHVAKGMRYSTLPRGIDQRRGFQDIPEDWAESFRQEPPVAIHERPLTPAELEQGAAIRPFQHAHDEESRAWMANTRKHHAVCGAYAKHHPLDCPFRKPKAIEKPNPTLAVWKADRRRRLGGSWIDPEDGVPVSGHPEAVKAPVSHDDALLAREEAASKWKGWTSEKSGVVMLEANLFAAIQGQREVGR